MGIRKDLAESEAKVNEYIGLVKASTLLAEHEGVTREEAARWLLTKRFNEKLPAYEIGSVDWTINALGEDSSSHSYEILWCIVAFDSDDDEQEHSEEVFWHIQSFAELLVESGIAFNGATSDPTENSTAGQPLLAALQSVPTVAELASGTALSIRAETTYLNIIGALLNILMGSPPHGDSQLPFRSQADLLEVLEKYRGCPGMSARNLQAKFAAAKRSINQP
jgi:hypothetical protein